MSDEHAEFGRQVDYARRGMNEPQPMRCLNVHRIDKGALVAIVDIEIPAWDMIIRDCKWFRNERNEWVGLPSVSFQKRDGTTAYKDIVEFKDKERRERFSNAALQAAKSWEPKR